MPKDFDYYDLENLNQNDLNQIESVGILFSLIDTNSDGKLSFTELYQFFDQTN